MKKRRLKVIALLALGVIGLVAGLSVAESQHRGGRRGTTAQGAGGGSPDATNGEGARPSTGPRPAPIIYRPHYLSRSTPVPLLIALHPSGETPLDWRIETRFNVAARRYGFVAAYLGSLPALKRPGAGPAWRKIDLQRNLSYISSEISTLIKTENIDPKRVYVTGFSAGATMSYFVACRLSSQIAGVAAVSGAMLRDEPCHPSHPISEMLVIGSKDLVPIDGSKALLSASELASTWRAIDGCANAPAHPAVVGSAQTQTWTGCRDNTAVALVVIPGGRHHYPGEPYGAANPDTNYPASHEIWAFFASHPGA